MRSPLVRLGIVLACATTLPAAAHHSASRWTSFFSIRYLVCVDRPATKVACVGPVRARRELLAALAGVGDLAPGTNHDHEIEPAHAAAVEAVYFHVPAAIPSLRVLLDKRPEPRDRGEYTFTAKQALRAEAAYALAHLGDAPSAPVLADLVRELETTGSGSLWEDVLEALAVLDPPRASRYAIDFMSASKDFASAHVPSPRGVARGSEVGGNDFRTSLPGGSSKLRALDYIRDEHAAAALPVLEALAKREETGYDHAHCLIMATRTRLDPKLRAQIRTQLVGHYSGTWLAGCANDVIAQLGVDPEDAAALVRHLGRDDLGMDFGVANIAYRRILELLATMAAAPPSARITRAREVLRRGLTERSTWPHVADPSHRNYSRHFVAFHFAALAGLGDRDARRTLDALIDDASDPEGTSWIAAYWAVRLDLPGARDHAAALAGRSLGAATAGRGDVFRAIRVRTLDAFADRAPDDPRWTIALLDPERDTAERALYRFSRRPPAGACDVVTAAARQATPAGVEHALLGLTTLGTTCRPAIEQLFADATVAPEIRGAALEFLAVLEAPRICEHLARARREGVWRPAIERAALLVTRSCQAVRPAKPTPVDQPLPPRSHRQGL